MPDNFILGSLIGGGTSVFCVVLHHEFLYWWAGRIRRFTSHGRSVVLRLVLSLMIVHCLEIVIFACAYYLTDLSSIPGELMGEINEFGDYIYFSAAVYTTVGYGDITPIGVLRPISIFEALLGLVLITWSASFTFPEMKRFWKMY